jgi:uncharacterized membrane protein YoaK (UPF0700 family)
VVRVVAIADKAELRREGVRGALDRLTMRDARHGPLPPLLLLLTVVTGLVDAVSFLALGHVFVANMTGNIVFLGFATVDAADFSVPASLAAILAFLLGALAGGRLGGRFGLHRGRLLTFTIAIETLLVAFALAVALAALAPEPVERYFTIVALSIAMGLQNAMARRLAVPDLTTTVLTLTLTGFAADSTLAGGSNPRPGRRIIATVAMFVGAAVGALLQLRIGSGVVLALVLVLLLASLAAAAPYWRTTAAWTQGA